MHHCYRQYTQHYPDLFYNYISYQYKVTIVMWALLVSDWISTEESEYCYPEWPGYDASIR